MTQCPEIIVSTERSVLKEILNPRTLAVCWDPAADPEFQSHLANVRAYDTATNHLQDYKACPQAQLTHITPVFDAVRAQMEVFDALLARLGAERTGAVQWWEETLPYEDGIRTHVDADTLSVFFMMNEKNGASSCVPREDCLRWEEGSEHFIVADRARAIQFPSASVYIIKLAEQPHFGVSKICADEIRQAFVGLYQYPAAKLSF